MPDIPKLDSLSLRMAAANALIRRRRTIKPVDMSEVPVRRDHLTAILENGNWAPTHGMTQPWRFFVYTGAGREKLASFLQSLYRKITPPEEFRQEKFDKLASNALLAPVVMAIGMVRQRNEKISEFDELAAVACAVQNMHLTASALGMAAFWATPPLVHSDEMRQWLGLEDKRDRCLGLFYLGWPRSETWPEGEREDVASRVVWMEDQPGISP